MNTVIVTGSLGLIGSESVKFFSKKGFKVIGIDNDMRKYFFGAEASTAWNKEIFSHIIIYSYNFKSFFERADSRSIFVTITVFIFTLYH